MIQMATLLQVLQIIQQELINVIILYVTVIIPRTNDERHVLVRSSTMLTTF